MAKPTFLTPAGRDQTIAMMNEVFLGLRGRGGYMDERCTFAAEYFFTLVEGRYLDLTTRVEKESEKPVEYVIDKSIRALLDFTRGGFHFLYTTEPFIPQRLQATIAEKIIEKVEEVTFTDADCADTAFNVLTQGRFFNFPSTGAKNYPQWYDKMQTPDSLRLINGALRTEVLDYVRHSYLFAKP